MNRVLYFGAIAAGALALPFAAFASHGKVGLWDVTTTMNMGGGAAQMPDLSKLPPEQRAMVEAQMKKSGLSMNGNTISTQHCMTAAEVAQDKPPTMGHMKDCTVQNMKFAGGTMTADSVCSSPEMSGKGHISVSYNGATSYSGSMTFKGTAQGHPIDMNNTFSGHWVSADCGGVTR
ncbi:MAG TPA: DUF3617 domain-containing protein [Rhizomicrobium sp.]|jgi:hypothetical protein